MKNLSIKLFKFIKIFWQKNETKILVTFAFILLALASFNAGKSHQKSIESAKINMTIVEKPSAIAQDEKEIRALGEALERKGEEIPAKPIEEETKNVADVQKNECAFVGSKNSNKYHLPTCRYVKNINPENLVCFSSEEEAKAKGYLPDKNCIK